MPNALYAAPLILETGEPVMSVSGFVGDRVLTPEITPNQYQTDLLAWLDENCEVLEPGVTFDCGL